LGVVNILGRQFTSLASVLNVVCMFVCGDDARPTRDVDESPTRAAIDTDDKKVQRHTQFSAFVENISYLYPEVFAGSGSFKCFDEFCRINGCAFSSIFVSNREMCRNCGKKLLFVERMLLSIT
jgi:hypothetical protein